jgi:hypothetical protein
VSTTFAGSSTRFVPAQVCLGIALQTAVAELCEVCWRQHLHKCLLPLSCCLFWLRPALWLIAARTRRRRLARPTYSVSADQGDLTILACLKENRQKRSFRMPLRAGQPRGMAASARSNDIGASRGHIMDDVAGKIIKRSVES